MLAVEEKTTKATQIHTCCNCGKTCAGMVGSYSWVGGQGDVLFYECPDCLNAKEEASRIACEDLKAAI